MTFPKPPSVRRYILFARAASVAVTVIGCLVLLGWLLGVGWLKSVFPGYVSMKANTATGFLLSGAAFTLFLLEKRTKATRFWTMLAGALVVTLGALTLSEYLGGWNLGIDQWLFRDVPNTVGTSEPGRMAPGTALCFVMIGIALLVSACAIPAGMRHPILAALGAAVMVGGGLACSCYIFDVSQRSHWWNYSGMAFHTAAAFVLLGCALLALVKSEGGMRWALNRTITSGFIIGVAMMLITSVISFSLTNRLVETSTWVSHTQEVLKTIQEVVSGMMDLESGQRGYIIVGDARLLEGRKQVEIAIHEEVAELRRLTADNPRQKRRLDQLEPLIARRNDFGDQAIAARQKNGVPTAEEMVATGTGIKLSDDLRQLLNEMRNEEYALLKKREGESNAASTSAFLLLPLGVLFSLTVLSLGFFFLNAGVGERAQVESALQQSEARMAGIVTSAMDAIISIDQAQRITLFNIAAEKMFRLPAAEIMGQSLDRLIPRRFRGEHGQHVEGFGKTGVTSRSMRSLGALGALSGLRADGEEFPIEASISQVRVAGQQIYTVILRDITERQRADKAAALLAAIVESSSDAIVGKDLESNITSWNAGAERMFGYTAGEIIGRSITQLIPADRQDDEGIILARIKVGESVKHFDTVRVKKDGGLIDVSVTVSPIRNSSGEIIGASKVARDVTDQKRAARALRESEERFRTMANSIPQLAWIARADGYIHWYNQRWYEYTGTTPEQMEGWDWQSVHDPEVLPKVMENWTGAIKTGEPFEMEFPLRGADGEFRAFLTRIHPLKDSNGRVVSWFGTNTDVQSLKQAQAALQVSEERLHAVTENLTEGLIVSDMNGQLLHWNRAGLEMHGFRNLEEGLRMMPDFAEIFDLRTLDGISMSVDQWPLARVLRGERLRDAEVRIHRRGRDWYRVFNYSGNIIHDASGQPLAFVAMSDITERKEAEMALQLSEERLRLVTDNARLGLVMVNRQRHYTFANAAYAEILGLPSPDIVDQRVADVLAPIYEEQIRPRLDRAFAGERVACELRKPAAGKDRFYAVRYEPAKVDGEVELVVVVLTDITERKQAENELAGNRAQLQAIFDNITEGICVLDRDRDIVHMNPACRRLLGLSDTSSSRKDVISAFEIISLNGETVPDEQWPATRALRGDFVRNLEFDIRQKVSGKTFSVEYNTAPIRDETGEAYQVILSYRDVTERRQSEARYRTLFDYAPDGILIADPESYYLDANASVCRMLGYTREELVGLHASDIVVQSEVPHIGEALSVIEARADYQREWQFRRKDGTVFAAEVIATMMPDGNLLGMIRDITERKRADAMLREAEKEKQLAFEASRLKSEFLANMSHELRTPLNCIIGFTEFLADEKPGPLNPKQKEYLTDVYNSSKHLLQLINDVLDLAKVEAGRIDLNLESFPLAKAIEEVCAVVKGIAQKKGVSVTSRVAPAAPNVTLDQQKFKQVCYNLMSNAVKFTDPGGSVEITALAREGEQFEVRVKDTGIGIRQEDLHRLFREFEQLDSGADRRFEGTGLGLALTKKLVESHGGSIGVESEYGSGSTFFALLPTIVAEVKQHE